MTRAETTAATPTTLPISHDEQEGSFVATPQVAARLITGEYDGREDGIPDSGIDGEDGGTAS